MQNYCYKLKPQFKKNKHHIYLPISTACKIKIVPVIFM